MCSKHVEAWNKLIIKFSVSSCLILINKYIEMHGQQNIKIWYLLFTLGHWNRNIMHPDVKPCVHDFEYSWWTVVQCTFLEGERKTGARKLELCVHILEFLNVTTPKQERERERDRFCINVWIAKFILSSTYLIWMWSDTPSPWVPRNFQVFFFYISQWVRLLSPTLMAATIDVINSFKNS